MIGQVVSRDDVAIIVNFGWFPREPCGAFDQKPKDQKPKIFDSQNSIDEYKAQKRSLSEVHAEVVWFSDSNGLNVGDLQLYKINVLGWK